MDHPKQSIKVYKEKEKKREEERGEKKKLIKEETKARKKRISKRKEEDNKEEKYMFNIITRFKHTRDLTLTIIVLIGRASGPQR